MMARATKQKEEILEVYLEDNAITSRFCSLPINIKTLVLELGLTMLDHVKQNAHDSDSKQVKDRILSIQKKHQIEIDQLTDKLCASEERYDEFTRLTQKRTEQTLANSEIAIKNQYQKEIDRIKSAYLETDKRYTALLEKHQSLHAQLENTYSIKLAEHIGIHSARVSELEEKLERHRREYDERIASLVMRGENSTIKGQDGETYMLNQLTMMFPSWEIEDTHSDPGRGDFLLRDNGLTIMVENKNYSKNVQKSEVDKFYRDIDNPANSDINCAIMVSMNTGICCKHDFDFEMRNGKPIMFLHKVRDCMSSIMLAVKFLKLIVSQSESLNLKDSEVISTFKNIASTIKRNFTKQRNRLDKFYSEQTEALATQETNIASLYSMVSVKY